MYRVLVRRVDVRLRRGHGDLDFVGVFAGLDFAEVGVHFVVAFGAPGDVAGGGEGRVSVGVNEDGKKGRTGRSRKHTRSTH